MKSEIENLTATKCHARFGGGHRWWQTRLQMMHEAGTISKKGRKFFGRMTDVEEWLKAPEPAKQAT